MTAAAHSHSSSGPHWLSTRRLRDRVQRHLVALPSLRLPLPLGPESSDADLGPPAVRDCRLTVHRRVCGAVVVVAVDGDLDADGAAVLDQRLRTVLGAGNLARLVVDLGRTRHLSGAGVRALLRAQEAGRASGIPLRVVAREGAADPVLDELRSSLPTAPDVDTACTEVFRPHA